MFKLTISKKTIFYLLLLTPLLAYIYSYILHLPKNVNFLLTFIVIVFGIFHLKNFKSYFIPIFSKFLLIFIFYKIGWRIILDTDSQINIYTQFFYYIQDFALFFIIIIIYNTQFTTKFIENSILLMKLTIVFAAIITVIQVFNTNFLNANSLFDKDYENNASIYEFRRLSIFGIIDPNALGLAFIPLLSVLMGYMIFTKHKQYLLFMLLGGIVAILSNTRYVIIGYFIITFQLLFFNKTKVTGYFKYIFILLIFIITFIIFFNIIGYNIKEWFDQRLFAEGSVVENTRYKAFDTFFLFFPQKPIFGFGEMTKDIINASNEIGSSHIHVGYLSHLVAYGIFGCFFLYGFWFLLLRRFYKTYKLSNFTGSYFAFLMFLFSFSTMSQSSLFYYGLLFALIFDKFYRDKYINISINKK